MAIELKEKISNIQVTLNCESQAEIEEWRSCLKNFFEEQAPGCSGELSISGPCEEVATTRFWLKRAILREKVEACSYDTKTDCLIPRQWRWSQELGSRADKIQLPIVAVGNRKTLFLDRDGVINVDDQYVYAKEKFNFMPGVFDLLRWANEEGFQIAVLTNQSGVGRGFYEEKDVLALHAWVDKKLEEEGLRVDGWYYSPYHPESTDPLYRKESYSRKPGSGLAIQAAQNLSIDFENSLMIGDKLSDRLSDLDIPTFFLQGAYDLKESENIYTTHSDLLRFLKSEFNKN